MIQMISLMKKSGRKNQIWTWLRPNSTTLSLISNFETTVDQHVSQNDPYGHFSEIEDPLIRQENSRGQNTLFEQLKDQFVANKSTWTDDEKEALASLLSDDQMTIEGESSNSTATEEEIPFTTASIE
ncbi:hypothetical protein EYC84_002221 [Monilinia fructicola]|uniref:Uncharacterized protein n=1 Tax=Monilinia fructicola TaxID=38448 RepID=A0A5M9JK46_MONFR|nr:hypothetical protein EYC84_002221 [Monilinia fructicola]